ncbi:hypothetical protein [Acinetobacter sp. Ac_5812]|uniref:hypothetical protein n=1 Tax=Acinetobacter sp. Ac_5812 TaxID=1848937 RepID=UPI001490452E|nr:hypothetical protein [Acinetobacter sp. Ac_5812]NNP70411.1 hypothetical protein [Acinetobacter sp. Ac_5812]
MKKSSIEYLRNSNRSTSNSKGLLEGYKLYLEMNERKNEYMSRLVYVRKNIPETEYLLYGVKNQDELIIKLDKLFVVNAIVSMQKEN